MTTGVVATNATAAPAPAAAVSAVADDTSSTTATAPVRHGVRQWWKGLSDTQRQCLQDAKITRPVGPLDDAQRKALRDQVTKAAEACKVELPFPKARAFWNGLTDTQKQCLDDANVTRPWGPMTKEQRKAVRADLKAAAEKCGVQLPQKPANSSSPTPAPSTTAS
ncbi:MAG: hypothetical protein IE926_14170 [Micrococcales bacterium]|nr:hypothetical protein [Micrococcales bacterium]